MKNQFILNPSMKFIEETADHFSTKDAYVSIDKNDVHSIMDNVDNVLIWESKEETGSDRVNNIIADINSCYKLIDGYDFRTVENIILSIEYPVANEITIDETDNILNAFSNINSSSGLIWGANPVDGNSMKVKLIATNLEKL